MVLFLSGSQIRHAKPYETYFRDSVQGLDVGAPVKYRGVAIGAVTEVGLVSAAYGRDEPDAIRRTTFRTVFVRFEIDVSRVGEAPNADSVARGLRARIAPQGLTGLSYVELDFTNPAQFPPLDVPWTPRYDYIPSVPVDAEPGAGCGHRAAGQDPAGRHQRPGERRAGPDHGTARHPAWRRRGQAAGAGHRHAAHAAIGRIRTPTCRRLTAELRQTLASARTLAQGPQTQQLLRSATAATDKLTQAVARLPQLIASLDAVAQRADSGSADLEAGLVPLLRDARTTVAALRQTSEALRRDPGQVVLGGAPPRSQDR